MGAFKGDKDGICSPYLTYPVKLRCSVYGSVQCSVYNLLLCFCFAINVMSFIDTV